MELVKQITKNNPILSCFLDIQIFSINKILILCYPVGVI